MDLILWRHAEAREAEDGEDDLARPLTSRGIKQAQRMAEWLNRFLPESTRVLVSPALRTRQTADALGRKYRTLDALAPGASASQLLAAARWPDSREPVLVVGHQPTLGQTAAYLMAGADALQAPAWGVRKGAAWWLRHRVRDAVPEVVLVSVRTPEKL
ncbi:MAG: phosphohistidine phosphatase SixA [Burkholderiales bacterium]|nr:phosphohistidine phosphatase SixA [Burkholderiales bacterium]